MGRLACLALVCALLVCLSEASEVTKLSRTLQKRGRKPGRTDRVSFKSLTRGPVTALGMQDRRIPDGQVTSSSMWDPAHAPQFGRLHNRPSRGCVGCWCSRQNDQQQWLQIKLNEPSTITAIVTQGRPSWYQWVTSYKIQTSQDCQSWITYAVNGVEMVFRANRDMNTVVKNDLRPPVSASCVRILPVTWYNHISMRVELNGYTGPCAPCGVADDGPCCMY